MKRKHASEINTGSMADIAFLLLIFFLVTTTMDVDRGIFRKLPEKQQKPEDIAMHDRNVMDIIINRKNEILVDNELTSFNDLQKLAIDFIDNGGGKDIKGRECNWCESEKKPHLSDHPTKAFIAINADRNADYGTYILVLDYLNTAYALLRNKLANKLFSESYTILESAYKKDKNNKDILEKIKIIRKKYPLLIADIETDDSMAKK